MMRRYFSILALISCAPIALVGAGDAPSIADQILSELEAANRARSDLAREESAWKGEKGRLELLTQTLNDEIERLTREQADNQKAIEALRNSVANDPDDARLQERITLARECATLINQRLDELARTVPPGVVPRPTPEPSDPLAVLDAATKRLNEAERNAERIAVEIVVGLLDGQERSVKLLRIGGAAAWWVSLDGKQAGEAAMANGRLRLHPAQEGHRAEIVEALEIAEGRREPRIVGLPVEHVKIVREGGKP